MELKSFRIPAELETRLQQAQAKYSTTFIPLSIMEIFRRAWASYERGNVDATTSKYVEKDKADNTSGGMPYKHDLGDVDSKLLVCVLDVYLENKTS